MLLSRLSAPLPALVLSKTRIFCDGCHYAKCILRALSKSHCLRADELSSYAPYYKVFAIKLGQIALRYARVRNSLEDVEGT